MSLKHRGGSKYSKKQMLYAKYDDQVRFYLILSEILIMNRLKIVEVRVEIFASTVHLSGLCALCI